MSLSPADPLWPVLRADALADARQGRLSRLHVLREAGLDEGANAPLLDALRAGSGGAGLRLRLPAGPSCFVSFAQAAAGSVVELVLDAGSTAFPETPYDRPSVVCALLEAGTRLPRLRALEIPLGPVPPAAAAAFLRAHRDGLREVRLLSYGSDAGAVRQARAIGPALRELHSLEALYLSGRLWRAAGRDSVGNPLLPLPAGLRRMNAVLGFIPADALPPRLESLALQPRHMIHPDWPHDDPQAEADTERLLAVAPPTLRAMTCLRDDLHTLGPEHAARLTCARLPVNDPEGMRAGLRRLLRGDFPALRNLIDPASLDADCAELASLIAGRAWDGLVLNGSMPARPAERPASPHSPALLPASPPLRGQADSRPRSPALLPDLPPPQLPPLGAHRPSPLALAAVACPRLLDLMLLVHSDVAAEVGAALLVAHPELRRLDLYVIRGPGAPDILAAALEVHPGLEEVCVTVLGPGGYGETRLMEACLTNNAARRRREKERAAWAVAVAGMRSHTRGANERLRAQRTSLPARVPWHHHSLGGRVADFLGPPEPAPRLVYESHAWSGWHRGESTSAGRWWAISDGWTPSP